MEKKYVSIVPAEWCIIKAVQNVTTYQHINHPEKQIMEIHTTPNTFDYYWVKPETDEANYIGDYNGVFGVFGYEDRYKWLGDDGREETDEYKLRYSAESN